MSESDKGSFMKSVLPALALLFAATAVAQIPAITAVLDGAAYTPNLPPGAIFIVKGANLSSPGFVQGAVPTYPATLNEVQITLTAVGRATVVTARMVYTYNESGVNQLAALLPSSTSVGAYDLRVTNGATTSSPFRVNVVARKPGIITADGSGSGEVQATLSGGLILARRSNQGKIGAFETRPARPGERVDLWGTGLGPDTASDTGGTSGDQTVAGAIRVIVNGATITPLYAGRSPGYPGLDQIVFTMPTNVALGCAVTVQVRASGVLSNSATIAVSATDTCTMACGDVIRGVIAVPGQVDVSDFQMKPGDLKSFMFRQWNNSEPGNINGRIQVSYKNDRGDGEVVIASALEDFRQSFVGLPVDANFLRGRLEVFAPSGGTGAYRVGFNCIFPASPVVGKISGDGIASGQLREPVISDQFSFEALANQRVSITVRPAVGDPGLLEMRMYSPSGRYLGQLQFGGTWTVTLPESGAYVIQVANFHVRASPSYWNSISYWLAVLRWQDFTAAIPVTPLSATLACGGRISGSIGQPGEADLLMFAGSSNSIDVTLRGTGLQVTGAFYVHKWDSGLLVQPLVNGVQRLLLTPERGPHFFQIGAADIGSTGSYTFDLTCR